MTRLEFFIGNPFLIFLAMFLLIYGLIALIIVLDRVITTHLWRKRKNERRISNR